ncbi:MAG: sucrase ferredoxin [Propionibacteriaceae bacterium]
MVASTDLCSLSWDSLSGWGTAARAQFWVAIEQPGSWGKKAFSDSLLPDELAAFERTCKEAGGKALLIRKVGVHYSESDSRRIYISGGSLEAPWLVSGVVADPMMLLDLPFSRLCDSTPPVLPGFAEAAAIALICTNGKRDVCCAVRGRPLAESAAQIAPDRVWEASHTGGHRFAPTAVVLPTGQMLAHVSLDDVISSIRAADEGMLAVVGPGDRGRSQLEQSAQTAESWVRSHAREYDLDTLATVVVDDIATVVHTDGRSWRLRVAKTSIGQELQDSCGRDPHDAAVWTAELLS